MHLLQISNYKKLSISLILLFCLNIISGNERIKYNFNHDWKIFIGDTSIANSVNYNDNDWKNVTLPYAWNQNEAFKLDIKDLSTGIAWYRKHFKLPADQKGKKVFIEFEGVRQAASVYVNGKFIGLHENGITAFGFDISDYLWFGDKENIIAVRTDNSWDYKEKATDTPFQWNDRNFNANYGGITKNVTLHITGKIYQTLPLYTNLETTGQYIYATNFNIKEKSADITSETQVKNETNKEEELTYEVQIIDLDGKPVKTIDGGKYLLKPGETKLFSVIDHLSDLHFWSWGYGYLYIVNTILKRDGKVIDKVSTRTGFRKTEFSNGMIKLNDRVIMVKGYAQRTSNEWPAIGTSIPPSLSDYSNQLMVESNANLVRWMHITPSRQDVESCDRVGLMQAMPAGDSEKDREGRKWEQRVEVMRDAIIYFRNNPSIIFYESGNKEISEEHMQKMKDLRDKYDPHGGRAAGCREMLDSKVAEYGGEMLYVNKSDEKPLWAMEYMRDEALRKYWDDYSPPYHKNGEGALYKGKDASDYNQNQDSYACTAVKRWYDYYRERPGTGKRVSSGGVNIIFSETNTHHRGEENYRRSGEVDALRIPKDAFYAHQVMWNGWVDIEKYSTHIIGHWNYDPGTIKNVYVVSSGEKVELKVNNQSLGYGRREFGFLFTFDSVRYEAGTIEAISYNKNNEVLSKAEIKTAGAPYSLKLTLINPTDGIFADGSDIALIQVEVTDNKGNRCPIAMNEVRFDFKGPAEWLGGMAQGPDNYILSKNLPVECGVNRVLLRSLTEAGNITLTARSEGLVSDSISFYSKSIEVKNGLPTFFPSENLPSNLEKGSAPSTESFTVSRKSVDIIGATAGANQEDVHLSFDGSQNTRWVNDGKLETGWIDYQLEREAEVSEIALKLSGWRTRSYPIEVSLNDTIIFKGLTEPNLGYFYIKPDKPVKADHVKIRLFGQSEINDAYNIVEITGKLDKETANDMAVQNVTSLNIVEIELFEEP
ncbi:MAG: DUF4982 domain-containing protein [Bacteroidales bacterium]|nr:DUF4982 domain-containing protein [Bacteroidales bacterium]